MPTTNIADLFSKPLTKITFPKELEKKTCLYYRFLHGAYETTIQSKNKQGGGDHNAPNKKKKAKKKKKMAKKELNKIESKSDEISVDDYDPTLALPERRAQRTHKWPSRASVTKAKTFIENKINNDTGFDLIGSLLNPNSNTQQKIDYLHRPCSNTQQKQSVNVKLKHVNNVPLKAERNKNVSRVPSIKENIVCSSSHKSPSYESNSPSYLKENINMFINGEKRCKVDNMFKDSNTPLSGKEENVNDKVLERKNISELEVTSEGGHGSIVDKFTEQIGEPSIQTFDRRKTRDREINKNEFKQYGKEEIIKKFNLMDRYQNRKPFEKTFLENDLSGNANPRYDGRITGAQFVSQQETNRNSTGKKTLMDLIGTASPMDIAVMETENRKRKAPPTTKTRKKRKTTKEIEASRAYRESRQKEIERENEKRKYDAQIPCAYYQKNGVCDYGENCRFSHDFVVEKKMELCKFYVSNACLKGDNCMFYHSEWPCKFFHVRQSCKHGDACSFSHAELSPKMKEAFEARLEVEESLKNSEETNSAEQANTGISTATQSIHTSTPSIHATTPSEEDLTNNATKESPTLSADSNKKEFHFPSLYTDLS